MKIRKLCVYALLVALLIIKARGSPCVYAAERDRAYAPLTELGVTYVSVLTTAWSPSTYYEDDLEDMLGLIGAGGYNNVYVYRYRFSIDTLSEVMVKYRGSLRKSKHGTLEIRLAESLFSDGSIIIGDKRLDKNEDYWVGILPAGVYYLKVPIDIELAGNPFYDEGWLDNPYLKFDVTAKRITLFGSPAVDNVSTKIKPVVEESVDNAYRYFKKIYKNNSEESQAETWPSFCCLEQ